MRESKRHAVFAVPQGAFHDAGAAWLGWDSLHARPVAQPALPSLPISPAHLTDRPRKYGFHATLKAPFRLADGYHAEDLQTALGQLARERAPVTLQRLCLHWMGGFLALCPDPAPPGLSDLAGAVVTGLDRFRAPLTQAELHRRRRARLSARQEAHLATWGYPHVLDQFRFHLTLTGPVRQPDRPMVEAALADYLAPFLATPWQLDSLALMVEDGEGRMTCTARLPLGAAAQPR